MANQQLDLCDISLLTGLQDAVTDFGCEIKTRLLLVGVEISRVLSWLEERVLHWQREVERARHRVEQARSDLNHCQTSGTRDRDGRYRRPDCSAEQAALARAETHLRECTQNLEIARYWRGKVEQAVNEYGREERRLGRLAGDHTRRTAAHLQELGIRYEAVQVSERLAADLGALGEVSAEQAATLDQAAFLEQQMLTGVIRLMQVEGIRPETWRNLDKSAHLKTLQEVENCLANVQNRKAAKIVLEKMNPRILGSFDGKIIRLNSARVKSDRVQDVVGTVVHEGRHAYQHYAVKHRGFHPDADQVRAWRTNLRHPLDPEIYGYELYSMQAVEADARGFEARFLEALYG